MGECVKSVLAVISSQAAFTHTAETDLAAVNQTAKSVKVLLVDYFAVVCVFKGILAVLMLYLFYNLSYKFILYGAFAENIIGSNAGLTAV